MPRILRAGAQHNPDVMVAELRLPNLSGTKLLRDLREDGCTIPFVIVDGVGTIRSAVEAMHLGATNHVGTLARTSRQQANFLTTRPTSWLLGKFLPVAPQRS
jgi:FixJ family two-component response regulator